MNPDEQMVARGFPPGSHNLAIGEPAFLQEAFNFEEDAMYPPSHGSETLLKTLSIIHPGYHAVVANGAKQALCAAMYAFKCRNPHSTIEHVRPYWPSFSTLAELVSLPFNQGIFPVNDVRILTYPNNPTGINPKEDLDRLAQIWDSVYASEIYGYSHHYVPNFKIRVDGMSKRYGLSGLRVGWLITTDKELADSAAHYVEITTSGVSTAAQNIASNIILNDLDGVFDKDKRRARQMLVENAEAFKSYMTSFVDCVEGLPRDYTGMFAFFHVKPVFQVAFDAALKKEKIFLVNGKSCGMLEEGWYRMNLGQTTKYVRDTLKALREELVCQIRIQS